MTPNNEQGQRLRTFRAKILKMNQTVFGKAIRIGRDIIGEMENGQREIDTETYNLIQAVHKGNPTWIKTGKGEPLLKNRESRIVYDEDEPFSKVTIEPFISHVNDNFTKMHVYKRTGAGNEMVGDEYEPIETIVVPRKLYKRQLIPFKVIGDSMEKLIMENSIVLVDTTPQDLEDTKIYCFRIPYRGFVIRSIQKMPDGLYLEPFNKQYEAKKISWNDFEPESIIGRVLFNIINPFR